MKELYHGSSIEVQQSVKLLAEWREYANISSDT